MRATYFVFPLLYFSFALVPGTCIIPGYRLESMKKTNAGYKGILTLIEGNHGPYGSDISPLQLDVRFETSERLHVKIWAPGRQMNFPSLQDTLKSLFYHNRI
jgi:hypothetical protein